MRKHSVAAFTLIEMLVVIAIIATLAAFAVPALTSALTQGQLTGTMNNARQLFLAAQQMALDGASNSDPNYGWPGDLTTSAAGGAGGGSGGAITTLEEYSNRLVQNDYLKAGDLQKLLNAPGAACTVNSTDSNGTTTVTLTGKSALKVYKVKETDPANSVFSVTNNFVYNTALAATAAPYGDKGFVVIRKGGDAAKYKKNQATSAGFSSDARKYQNAIGKLPGDPDGTPSTESSTNVLTGPSS
jgi:prepilin-type N-terminal cleavage/methylation domain-containing protein